MRRRSVEILAAAVVLFVSVSPVMAGIEFKDGMTHDIDYQINEPVSVDYESPGLQTTLNILDGATIPSGYYVTSWEDSIINILGGSMNWLRARDRSLGTASGGWSYWLTASDTSQVTVSGGSITGLRAYESSQVTVSGGSINNYLRAYASSQVSVSGGSITGLHAYESSQVTVSGGSIGRELRLDWDAVLTIHGSDFAVEGTPVGYTELYSILGGDCYNEPYRQLTGTLLSGDPINNQFRIGHDAKIVLVPEPATLLLLGLGGLALLRNRRFR